MAYTRAPLNENLSFVIRFRRKASPVAARPELSSVVCQTSARGGIACPRRRRRPHGRSSETQVTRKVIEAAPEIARVAAPVWAWTKRDTKPPRTMHRVMKPRWQHRDTAELSSPCCCRWRARCRSAQLVVRANGPQTFLGVESWADPRAARMGRIGNRVAKRRLRMRGIAYDPYLTEDRRSHRRGIFGQCGWKFIRADSSPCYSGTREQAHAQPGVRQEKPA